MATPVLETRNNFQEFLDAHLSREMLRFTTAGSVDDGKSTLIGRLLHDTRAVYDDQLASIRSSSVNRSTGPIDFSLLTDGLRAEREQGITIDVAYRYFSTARRKFIIADTPGHEQYTRNMATGASTADVAIILIDAVAFERLGSLLPQSRRHTFIASLLGIPHLVAAVNKMDLAGYSEERFAVIEEQFRAFAAKLGRTDVQVIPLSALAGDNVVDRSAQMPWYKGPALLEYLETAPLADSRAASTPLRFPVQLVLRPDANFRGYAGQVASGTLHAGSEVLALPSRRQTRVKSIVTFDGNLDSATAPVAVAIQLEDEIDLSRGEMLVAPESLPYISSRFSAKVVWMHEQPLRPGSHYLIKHTTRTVRATVTAIRHRIDIQALEPVAAPSLSLNEIGVVEFETNRPLFFDTYEQNRATGHLILIDPLSNATVGAAMIDASTDEEEASTKPLPVLLHLPAQPALSREFVQAMRASGRAVVDLDDAHIATTALPAAVRAAQMANAVAVTAQVTLPESVTAEIIAFLGADQTVVWKATGSENHSLADLLEGLGVEL
jgi:bifunctional enzyme CysN/CysC/sulfate adenylyltransferase subunit 1